MDADSSDEDPSSSEDEDAWDDGDDDDDAEGSLGSFIDGSEEAVDWKHEFDMSERRLVMQVDAVLDEAERFMSKHGNVMRAAPLQC